MKKKPLLYFLKAGSELTKILRIMRFITIMMIIGIFQVNASVYSQNEVFSFKESGLTMRGVFKTIEKTSKFKFFFNDDLTNVDKRVDLVASKMKIDQVLDAVLAGTNLSYKILENNLIIISPSVLLQQKKITGTITDANTGQPLIGVSIKIKGTNRGAVTDVNGKYTLEVPNQSMVLVYTYMGYLTESMPVSGMTDFDIKLKPDVKTLDEVVVVGYGTQKKSLIVGSSSSISEKLFKAQPVTRVDQILQGRASGVQITNDGGAPGGDVRIRVRGSNSFSGDNSPLYVIDGYVGADFNTLNPDDIASIEVLKDAASTAIYGSRGANGVIIITTKVGKKGDMKVDFGYRYYSSNVLKKWNTLNAGDFAQIVNERLLASNQSTKFTDAEIANYRATGGTDWQNEVFRTAPGQEYQLGISGGNDKTSYLISGNYLGQDGIILNSNYKRYSIRSNINSQLSKKFSTRFIFNGSRRENLNTDGTAERGSIVSQALSWAPTTPVRDASGKYIYVDPTSSLFENPVAMGTEVESRAEKTNANIVTGLRYDIIEGLSFDTQFGLNYLNTQTKNYSGILSAKSPQASAGRASGEDITWQNTNTLNYKRTFNKVHAFDITVVNENQHYTGTAFNVNVNNLTYPDLKFDNLALSKSSIVGSGYSSWALSSLLGRVNYSFNDRYLFSGAIRRDGSSKFQGDHKYSVFPSLALGWRVSQESFMKSLPFINNFKIRGSWGLTGNQAISPYGTLSSYVTNTDDAGVVFNGNTPTVITNGIMMGNPGNPDLKWETTEQTNVGVDVDALGGRISLTVDYFDKKTRDLLMLNSLPGYLGGYSIMSNIGKVQNKGWEFSLSGTPVSNKDFTWTSSLNFSILDNKVLNIGKKLDTLILSGATVLIKGQRMNSYWGYKFLGTWKPSETAEAAKYGCVPGDAKYDDRNKDGKITTADYQVIGNGMPKTSIGWNNTFTYKNWSLNMFLQGLFGYDKMDYTYALGMVGGTDTKEIIFSDIKNRYIAGVNETSDIPAFGGNANNSLVQTSRFIEKGGFLRLKNLSLSYDLPKSALKNIAGIRVFVSVTNLLTFTKYKGIDPESNSSATSGTYTDLQQGKDYGSYPNSRTYTAGINFSF